MIKFKEFVKGILLRITNGDATHDEEGALYVQDDSGNKLKAYLDSGKREVLTDNQTQTVENKTIDGTDATGTNTITCDSDDVEYDNTTSGLVATDVKGALDELKSELDGQNEADEIPYDNAGSTLVATNVQDAIDEVDGKIEGQNEASEITYSNATSGLTATDVQAAIDEVKAITDDQDEASEISYDNSSSGLASSDVQNAIDEVEGRVDTAESNISGKLDTFTSSNDGRVVRTDTDGNAVQESGVTISDTDEVTGVTSLTVDNINIDGTSISNSSASPLILSSSSSSILSSHEHQFSNFLKYNPADLSDSGSQATPSPTRTYNKLTNASLVSISGFANPNEGRTLILANNTGNSVDILNDDSGASAANRVITGTGQTLEFKNDTVIILLYDDTDDRWKIVGGTGSGSSGVGNGLVSYTEQVTSATTGSFSTGISGEPIIVARFWDNSNSRFEDISPASLQLDITNSGQDVAYDTTSLTFDTSDYIDIICYYSLVATPSSEFDSLWITVSGINNTPSAGLHSITLPSGIKDIPSGFSLIIDDGTDIIPGDYNSRIEFTKSGSTITAIIDTSGLSGTDKFRFRASSAANPVAITGDLEVGTITSNGRELSGDNILINPAFVISQRGDFTTQADYGNGYHIDRWTDAWSGVGAVQTQQVSTNQPSGLNNTTSWKYVVQATASGVILLQQRVEDFTNFAGKTVTFSMYVKSDLDTNPSLTIDDGVGTTYSTAYSGAGSWQRLTVTRTIDNNPTRLYVGCGMTGSVTFGQFQEVTGAKLEIGSLATAFETPLFITEYVKCLRYYQKSYDYARVPGSSVGSAALGHVAEGVATSTTRVPAFVHFQAPMRAFPTINLWDYNGNAGKLTNSTTFTHNQGTGSSSAARKNDKGISLITNSGLTTGVLYGCCWTAEAEI